MLRLAVKRNLSNAIRDKGAAQSHVLSELPSYVICDPKSKGVIRHASQGFQDFFGDCEGQVLCPASELLQSNELKIISKELGLSSDDVATSIHRMAKKNEEAVQSTATGTQKVPVLLSHSTSGQLFACEICWHKNQHPTLGWSYYAGLVQVLGISVNSLLMAACQEVSYGELCVERSDVPSDLTDHVLGEMHASAEKMWKDELTKGVKPKGTSKRRSADMSSIWSRSTASTMTSSKEQKHAKADGEAFGSHHFGALLGMLPSEDQSLEKPVPEEHAQLPSGENFQSASEDEFQDCETMSSSSSLSLDSGPPLFDEVDDPVKHVDRPCVRQMKQAFALCVLGTSDQLSRGSDGTAFPVALRSAGLEESAVSWPSGPARKAQVGSNAREVLQPTDASGPQAKMYWKSFCECFERQEFFKTDGGGIALLGNSELALPAGEFAFVQPFHGRLGNPIDCLVYVKHIELDDCPYLLALHSYMPNEPNDHSLEDEFFKLSSHLDGVISELASEFFYYAPMRRQRTFRHGDQ